METTDESKWTDSPPPPGICTDRELPTHPWGGRLFSLCRYACQSDIREFQIAYTTLYYKALPDTRALSLGHITRGSWEYDPEVADFLICLVSEVPVLGVSRLSLQLPSPLIRTVTLLACSLWNQGFFTTNTICCPDSQRTSSLSTWPPRCPLVDTLGVCHWPRTGRGRTSLG